MPAASVRLIVYVPVVKSPSPSEPVVLAVVVDPAPPVVPVPVATPLLVAELRTEEAAADPVVVPIVPLFVPFPSGTLSLRSGKLNVLDPSPVPKVVPITANKRA